MKLKVRSLDSLIPISLSWTWFKSVVTISLLNLRTALRMPLVYHEVKYSSYRIRTKGKYAFVKFSSFRFFIFKLTIKRTQTRPYRKVYNYYHHKRHLKPKLSWWRVFVAKIKRRIKL
jgi:hypothetical protein